MDTVWVVDLTIGCSCVLSHRMFTLHICSQCAIRCDCLLSLNVPVFLSHLIMFILCFELTAPVALTPDL